MEFLNTHKFMQRCLSPIEDFKVEGDVVTTSNGIYIYKDNNAKVLAVAHLDSVQKSKHFRVREKKGIVYSPQLDDRAGVYTILDLLPSLGVETDILLTDLEEVGQSTAKRFQTTKEYNWIFSFDRREDDVVGYGFDDKEWREIVKAAGFRAASGSVSDIAYMEELGCKGFNFGVGYKDEHSVGASLSVKQLRKQVTKFVDFWKANKDTKFAHEKKKYTYNSFVESEANYRWPPADNYPRQFNSQNFRDVTMFMVEDPEMVVIVDGYESFTIPMSEFMHVLTWGDTQELIKKGQTKSRVARYLIDKYLEVPEVEHVA